MNVRGAVCVALAAVLIGCPKAGGDVTPLIDGGRDDVPRVDALEPDVVPSLTITFVGGAIHGADGGTSIQAQITTYGAIRGDNDAGTRIEAFIH